MTSKHPTCLGPQADFTITSQIVLVSKRKEMVRKWSKTGRKWSDNGGAKDVFGAAKEFSPSVAKIMRLLLTGLFNRPRHCALQRERILPLRESLVEKWKDMGEKWSNYGREMERYGNEKEFFPSGAKIMRVLPQMK